MAERLSTCRQMYGRFRGLRILHCPFSNLPKPRGGRWGQGLTAEKMKNQWLRPVLVGNSGSWNGRRTLTCGIRNSSRSGRIRCSRDAGCQARKDSPPVLFFTTTKLKSEYTGPYHTTR
jgi:hypothetical protein